MLISLDFLVKKYNVKITGILHVGAHECEELHAYEKYVGRDKILWVEAMTEKVDLCKKRYPNVLIERAIVSDKEETVLFNVANNGQSSSILQMGLHATLHPHVQYVRSYDEQSTTLRAILPKYPNCFNFVNLDIQGAELKALKGMQEYLDKVDYIYTEVNCDYVYKDCALIEEIDAFLLPYNLHRVETRWYMNGGKWGDAFYVKR
jgi:FkbM family methyltransferase